MIVPWPACFFALTSVGAALHDGAEILAASLILIAVLLFRNSQRDRTRTAVFSVVFAIALGGLFAATIAEDQGYSDWPRYLRGFFMFLEGVAVIALAMMALFRVLLPAVRVQAPRILQDVCVAGAHLVWGLIFLNASGVNLTSIVATSAVLTAVIGFSMQDTLGNLLAGIALQVDQSISVNDWIKIGELEGRVIETRWRYTAIETRNWETVIIPNSDLMKNRFLVLGRRQGQPTQWRRWVYFNVDFRHSPAAVFEAVESALRAARLPNVALEPPLHCVHVDVAESYSRYAVRYWLTDPAFDANTDSEIRSHVVYALKRASITPSIPARAIFLTEETAARAAAKKKSALLKRVKLLRRTDIFRTLSAKELRRLAVRLLPMPFKPGEVMARQGSAADGLYLVARGHAEVRVANADGNSSVIAELHPGHVFGERALLTGEPRSATVVARTEVECLRIDKDSFKALLLARHEVAEEISAILARREAERSAVLEKLDEEARKTRIQENGQDILGKIRNLFGLTKRIPRSEMPQRRDGGPS